MLPGGSLGIGGGERQLISLLLMATHVAGRGFRIEFPLGCKHEMVGVEEPEKERHYRLSSAGREFPNRSSLPSIHTEVIT
jgi:hypothetical protein